MFCSFAMSHCVRSVFKDTELDAIFWKETSQKMGGHILQQWLIFLSPLKMRKWNIRVPDWDDILAYLTPTLMFFSTLTILMNFEVYFIMQKLYCFIYIRYNGPWVKCNTSFFCFLFFLIWFLKFIFSWRDSCFTMLCWFLPYNVISSGMHISPPSGGSPPTLTL